jgi:RNA polymerase sigma-70 factor, ECF subfamily
MTALTLLRAPVETGPAPNGRGNLGEPSDFDGFFRAGHDPLLRFCWGLTTDREAARDVAQETMARAYRDWDRVGAAGSNPDAWARTVALNLVRSQWRRSVTAAAVARGLAHPASSPNDAGPDVGLDVDLERALRALPDRQREAVVLHHLLDLPVGECAALMEVGESTVKVHLQRGRAALALALGVIDEPGAGAANREVTA